MYSYILYVFLKINLDKKNKGKQYLEREFKKKKKKSWEDTLSYFWL